ncbi:MAG: ABC transporter substrate-binding protein, partial [bacterium]|nr:ABC transporter substrate-binding protein [bacterium]
MPVKINLPVFLAMKNPIRIFFNSTNYFFILMCFISSISCDNKETLSQKKSPHNTNGEIILGVVDNTNKSSYFVEGVKLAVKDINQKGGALGKQIRILLLDDEGSLKKALAIAKKLSRNPDVVAVIGHDADSDISLSASITYEKNGLLFISPWATQPELTQYNTSFIFRNVMSDDVTGRKMAEFADEYFFKDKDKIGPDGEIIKNRVAIVFDSESSAKRTIESFHGRAVELGIKIVTEKSYYGWQEDFKHLISALMRGDEFDLLFLGGEIPSAAIFIHQLRAMGMKKPILSTDYIDSPELWSIAGDAADETYVPTVFYPYLPDPPTRYFNKAFRVEYGFAPDTWAAQGYDAAHLLGYAIAQSRSIDPITISNSIRFIEDWQGATGSYTFKVNGGIEEKPVYVKVVKGNKFEFLDVDTKRDVDIYNANENITLRIPIESRVKTIDPGLAADAYSIEVIEQLFMGLTGFSPKNNDVIPELAESWEIMDDERRIYRFHIRKDVRWTDGVDVTAYHLLLSIKRNLSPDTACPTVKSLFVLKNAEAFYKGELDVFDVGVRVIDEYTIE